MVTVREATLKTKSLHGGNLILENSQETKPELVPSCESPVLFLHFHSSGPVKLLVVYTSRSKVLTLKIKSVILIKNS